jgi:hypothetical protein
LASTDANIGATVFAVLVVVLGLAVLPLFPATATLTSGGLRKVMYPIAARNGVPLLAALVHRPLVLSAGNMLATRGFSSNAAAWIFAGGGLLARADTIRSPGAPTSQRDDRFR